MSFFARSRSVDIIAWCGRFYCRRFPVDRGKWRVVQIIERLVSAVGISSVRTIRTKHDFLMHVDPMDFLQRHIYVSGTWEPHVAEVIDKYLKPGDTFLDIGANIGFFTLYAARIVGKSGKVHAFEPNPLTFTKLRQNVELNELGNVSTCPVALSDRRGEAALFLGPSGNAGGASLRELGSDTTVPVRVVTLDEVLQKHSVARIAMIKIDVEGAEFLALNGAVQTLRRDRPEIICEISEWSLERQGSSAEQLFEFLGHMGYKWRLLSPIRIGRRSNFKQYRQFDVHFYPNGAGA
jgi:FkbM family methyltransferase